MIECWGNLHLARSSLVPKKGPTHRLATLQYVIRRLVISRRQRVLIIQTTGEELIANSGENV